MPLQLKTQKTTNWPKLPIQMARPEPKFEPYVSGATRAGRQARLLDLKADKKR